MDEIEMINDIIATPNEDTLSNKSMNAKIQLNAAKRFLSNASNFNSGDNDINISCKMILDKYIEYLQYKVELVKKLHIKSLDIKYGKPTNKTPKSTSLHKKSSIKKEVSNYTSYDNANMLI